MAPFVSKILERRRRASSPLPRRSLQPATAGDPSRWADSSSTQLRGGSAEPPGCQQQHPDWEGGGAEPSVSQPQPRRQEEGGAEARRRPVLTAKFGTC